MSEHYNPPRQKEPIATGDPLEIELVYNVRPCGTCNFFWPDHTASQPYGPYPIYDFTSDYPKGKQPEGTPESYPWMKVQTREEGFPNGEVMDGCRKTPIMTIGINPNMTAFSPGRTGTSWAYPSFTSDNGTNAFAKYAYYYRYRNVYQERFDFDTIRGFLLNGSEAIADKSETVTADQIKAAKDGYIVAARRTSASPGYDLVIKYADETEEITITLQRNTGTPRYVLLFDHFEPNNAFKAGDVIAGKLNVPAGENLELYQQLQTYYEQFVPSLNIFSDFLKGKGHADADLKIGEDVGQLDMVACASPHWKPDYLGGSPASEQTIINNCVSKNAWAIKQLVQTRPAVLFLVGESSYNMFRDAFGGLIKRDPALPAHPYDYAFTLFRETLDSTHPTFFEYATEINGQAYSIKTRLIVTPHFSYDQNFLPQFRLSKKWLSELEQEQPACMAFLKNDARITFHEASYGYDSYSFAPEDAQDILDTIQQKYPDCWKSLERDYYNPHQMMAGVLEELYNAGDLGYKDATGGQPGYLSRTEGACHFCVNTHWSFPQGCPYNKPEEQSPPAGFLSAVAAEIVAKGKPQKQADTNTSKQ